MSFTPFHVLLVGREVEQRRADWMRRELLKRDPFQHHQSREYSIGHCHGATDYAYECNRLTGGEDPRYREGYTAGRERAWDDAE